jgi:hypothetical protein
VSTGAKVAIGCGIVVLVGIVGVAAVFIGGAYWVKGKVDAVTAEQSRIDDLKKKANTNTFTRPADSVIAEDRLVKFLDVRKRVFVVYQKHEPALTALQNKKQAELSDVTSGFTMINDIRLAQAQAQAEIGMSDDEYSFLVEQVYKSMWASEVAKSTGGKSVSQAAGEMFEKAASEMERASKDAEAARRQARAAKDSASTEAAEDAADSAAEAAGETSEQLDKSADDLRKEADKVRENARAMDVPPANIALFQKYEADIKKYAMSGLELFGL